MRDLRYAVVLQLKATLSAREAMVKSGAFQGIEETYREKCRETAALLRRAENASLAGPKDSSACDLDLSWMEEYTSDGGDLYQLALENLEEREVLLLHSPRAHERGFFRVPGAGICGERGDDRLRDGQGQRRRALSADRGIRGGGLHLHLRWPRLEKQYKDPYPGQETEERELVNSPAVLQRCGEDGTGERMGRRCTRRTTPGRFCRM